MDLPKGGGTTKDAKDNGKTGPVAPAAKKRRRWLETTSSILALAVWLYTYLTGPAPWLPWHYSFAKPGFEYVASSFNEGYALYYAPSSVRADNGLVAFSLGVAYSEPKNGATYEILDARLNIPDRRIMAVSSTRVDSANKEEVSGPGFPWRDIEKKMPAAKLWMELIDQCAARGIKVTVPVLRYVPAEWRHIVTDRNSDAYFRPDSVRDAGDHIAAEILTIYRPEGKQPEYSVFYKEFKFAEGKWRVSYWREFDQNFRQIDYIPGKEWYDLSTTPEWTRAQYEAIRSFCRGKNIPLE